MKPRSTRILPSFSPRSFCSSSARSRSSWVIWRRERSSSPSLRGRAATAAAPLVFSDSDGCIEGCFVSVHRLEKNLLGRLNHHLGGQAGGILPTVIEEGDAQDNLRTVCNGIQRGGRGNQHILHVLS